MPQTSKINLDANHLPLEVREHLMRGHHNGAISLLTSTYGLSEKAAEKLIEDYRTALRERKIALDIQIMNANLAQEEKEQLHLYWTWGVRIFLVSASIILLYLLAKSLSSFN